ncbi:MAG: Nif3-like dinuclear metal center hexameric protein [Lachnospiraceae bacterium]|nr:Nif3-like dinuclear metal center hexameric protein [Lachnospiraceae bacterium]MBQ6993900.1 Nif3-like dinuclear metal center hexameric protein [Lachnospiraceae bacterium]
MKCYEIIEKLETLSPVSYAEAWDNIGLLAGRRDKEVNTIYIALDATDDVIEEAVRLKADLLLTHHPLIFKKMSRVNTDDFIGRRVFRLIQNDICYYAMHTNFDVMGMADAAADELRLQNCQVLNVTYEDEISKEGCGRFGSFAKKISLAECAELVKRTYQVPNVRVFGNLTDMVEIAAVMPGSGGSYIQDALRAGADVMITGDIDHHEGIDAIAQGLNIIDAGHYGIEKLFIPYMKEFLHREFPNIQLYQAEQKEPFVVV